MLRYFLRRVLIAIPTLLALITISFFMIRAAPGGPFDAHRKATPEVMANLNRAYHLDEPLYQQFGRYVWNVAQLDFGPSFKYRDYTVSDLILRGFPISLDIGLWAIFFSTTIGMAIGTMAALRQNSVIDYAVMSFGMVGVAVPTFIVAPILQLVLAVGLGWLPVAGWDGSWQHKILPIFALSLPPIAAISRLTRGSMIESLRSNHVRTARAKGLGMRLTVLRHALLGGLLPTLAYLGPATAGIITGSVVIERAFSIPGIGRYFVEAASNRDYTLVMGTLIFYGALIIFANLIVDLAYSLVDPKVRYD
ncbi:MAG: oligopeptide transport system permease protein [Aliidongia sp.]|jgi:oligopeptide transport system permease protein|nr:oligopeptide transport system permease protein [Aliidongia sp.]